MINRNNVYSTDPQVAIRVVSKRLGSDGIRVTLEWIQKNQTQYSYNVSINQNVSTELDEMTTLQLVASYDTSYNVSILATPQCGQRIVTTSIELYYGMWYHQY